jgi:hypothetical protein
MMAAKHGRDEMARRTLTPEEKQAILAHESKLNPDAIVTIEDETDDHGNPLVHREFAEAETREEEPHGA